MPTTHPPSTSKIPAKSCIFYNCTFECSTIDYNLDNGWRTSRDGNKAKQKIIKDVNSME
jgi:hypothetical protein